MPRGARRPSAAEIKSQLGEAGAQSSPRALTALVDAALGGQTDLTLPLAQAGYPCQFRVQNQTTPFDQPAALARFVGRSEEVSDPESGTIILLAPGVYQVDFMGSFVRTAGPDIRAMGVVIESSRDGLLTSVAAWWGPNRINVGFTPVIFANVEAREDTRVRPLLVANQTNQALCYTAQFRAIRVG